MEDNMQERHIEVSLNKRDAIRLYDSTDRDTRPYFKLIDKDGNIKNITQDYEVIEEHEGNISVEFYINEPADTKLYDCRLTHAELEIANRIFGRKVGEIR